MIVADIMTTNVVSIPSSTSLAEARRMYVVSKSGAVLAVQLMDTFRGRRPAPWRSYYNPFLSVMSCFYPPSFSG
jgi:hypothetical protein